MERRRQKRELHEVSEHPELDLSDTAKSQMLADTLMRFGTALARIRQQHPDRIITVNIFGASTGSEGYSIVQEGMSSSLTERGYDTPAIVARDSSARGWRALTAPERRGLGPPAVELANVGISISMSKHIELHTQLAVENMPGLQQLWRVPGAGAPHGLPDYCIGARFIVHTEDGNLPNPFYHTIPQSAMARSPVQ